MADFLAPLGPLLGQGEQEGMLASWLQPVFEQGEEILGGAGAADDRAAAVDERSGDAVEEREAAVFHLVSPRPVVSSLPHTPPVPGCRRPGTRRVTGGSAFGSCTHGG